MSREGILLLLIWQFFTLGIVMLLIPKYKLLFTESNNSNHSCFIILERCCWIISMDQEWF